MTASELLEILKDYYGDDKTFIEETNDLLEQIYKGKRFIYQFEQELEDRLRHCMARAERGLV